MASYNVHGGHAPYNSGGAHGAIGILNESNEDRNVKNILIELLKKAGHTVYDCTCDKALNQNGVLTDIVNKCNQHKVDLDISIHLNSGRNDYSGDGNTGGTEVYGYDTGVQSVGARISEEIANTLVIRNRGFKTSKNLYVLKNTKSPAILIECCFVDDADDARHWNAQKCAEAIFKGITGIDAKTLENKSASVQLYTANGSDAQRWKVQHNKDNTVSLLSVSCGLALEVAGAGTKDGTKVQVYTSNGSTAQKWKITRLGSPYSDISAPLVITSALKSNFVLDVASGLTKDGATIDAYSQNNTPAQCWQILDHCDGTWTLINVKSSKALDVVGGGK